MLNWRALKYGVCLKGRYLGFFKHDYNLNCIFPSPNYPLKFVFNQLGKPLVTKRVFAFDNGFIISYKLSIYSRIDPVIQLLERPSNRTFECFFRYISIASCNDGAHVITMQGKPDLWQVLAILETLAGLCQLLMFCLGTYFMFMFSGSDDIPM